MKHVVDKFHGKLPKDELKKFAREVNKKLVASDYKNKRVDDPTAISSKQAKKVRKYAQGVLRQGPGEVHRPRKEKGPERRKPSASSSSSRRTAGLRQPHRHHPHKRNRPPLRRCLPLPLQQQQPRSPRQAASASATPPTSTTTRRPSPMMMDDARPVGDAPRSSASRRIEADGDAAGAVKTGDGDRRGMPSPAPPTPPPPPVETPPTEEGEVDA